jgi:N utilization substance protein A
MGIEEAAQEVIRLFAREVPELANGVIEVRAAARRPGERTKLVLASREPAVDAVGACVRHRGCRVVAVINALNKDIVDGRNPERVDLVLWVDDPKQLITNLLQPATIEQVILSPAERRATVIVRDDQVPLARGQGDVNLDLASRAAGWRIEITSRPSWPRHAD